MQITMTREGDRTYSWRPQSRLSRVFMTVMGLSLLVVLASFAVGAMLIAALLGAAVVLTAMLRVLVRGWLARRGGPPRTY